MENLKKLIARMKFWAGRGQQYCSLLFWAFTISQLFLLNLREYVRLTPLQYGILLTSSIVIVFLGVLTIGWADAKTRVLEAEQRYQHSHNPILMETLHRVREMETTLNYVDARTKKGVSV